MTAAKQLGGDRSGKRAALLDAAERLIQEEGYAALTSRRVAEQAGLKHQLIFYYFESFDDLLLAALRRGAEEMMQQLRAALNDARPLQALWTLGSDPSRTRFITEYMAMANHNAAVRAEITRYAETYRELQAEALQRPLARRGGSAGVSPMVLTVVTSLLARGLVLEASLGMSSGHAETLAEIETWLASLDSVEAAPERLRAV